LRPAPRARKPGAPLVGAALFAVCELAAGVVVGRFFDGGRAEAMLFLAFRPWLLVAGAALVAAWAWPRRAIFYAAALIAAGSAETILIGSLGARDPWLEMLRGLAGGAAVALAADLAIQAARRWRPRLGTLVAAAALGALLAAGAMRPYEALVLGPTAPRMQAGPKPALLLMTSLPLVWGQGGAFDPASRPSESYRALEREYDVRPIDAIEPRTLAGNALMLLAQPRLLAPEELVALDDWVRAGGRVLVLADPRFAWAADWPPGDALRPPERSLLGPLLDHWGLSLRALDPVDLFEGELGAERRRLVLRAPGALAAVRAHCARARFYLARCRIGRGEAVVLADADLLDERLWARPSLPRGHERHLRTADNPLILADLLDGLAGVSRERMDRRVAWFASAPVPTVADARRHALVLAGLPILAALAMGLALLYRQRRSPTNLSTVLSTVNNTRTEDFEAV
jgi:hypothetical protein